MEGVRKPLKIRAGDSERTFWQSGGGYKDET